MLSWYSGDKNMLESFKMEEDPDGTSQQVAVIMTGKVYREAGLKNSKHPEVEGMLYDKLCQIGKHKLRDDVRKMALSIALSVSDKEFQPTVDWLDNFMRRFCLSKKMMGFHSSAMLKQKGSTQREIKPAATLQNMTQDDVFSVLGIPTDCDPNLEGGLLDKSATSDNCNVAKQNSETDCEENKSNSEIPTKETVVVGTSDAVTDAANDVSGANADISDNNKDDVCNEKDGKSENISDKNVSSVPQDKKESCDEKEDIIVLDDSKQATTQAESSGRKKETESKIGKISIKKLEDLCEVGAKDEETGDKKGKSNHRKENEKSTSSDESEENSEESDDTDSEGSAGGSEKDKGSGDAAVVNGKENIEYSKAETKYYNKNKDALQKKLAGSVMKCTSCYEQVNHHISSLVFTHPVLGLFICKKCRKYYGKGKFRKDKEGFDEYCRLCAEGGDLLCCEQDGCFNGFCKRCVKRIMGRAELKRAENTEGWACYVCDPTPLMEPRALHRLILNNLRSSSEEDATLSRKDLKSKTLKNKFESLKQMRQLRSQREAVSSSSKPVESVKKTSKTQEEDKEMPTDGRKKSDKVIEKDEKVLKKNCGKTNVRPNESDDNTNPCPVLRKVMDEMLGMLFKCVDNIKTLDSKWKKSNYSSEGTNKTRRHVVKQLDAMRHNFEILEEDLERSEETVVKDNGKAIKEQNVIGLKRTKNLQDNKEDVEMMEEEINQNNTTVGEENDILDNCQSHAKIVSSEKDEKIAEKDNEQKSTTDTSVQPDFDLVAASDKLAVSVDNFEICSQVSSKAGLPSDDEHSLPDLTDVIKEIISDSDEPMDAEEKMTMIKSLDMESEVPELLGDVRQKRKTVQKNDCKPTDLKNKEDLSVIDKESMETGINSSTSVLHSDDKETTSSRIGKTRRLRSSSIDSRSDNEAGDSEKVQRSPQHKKIKLLIDSDDNYEGNGTLNRKGQANKKNKEIVDGNCNEADKEVSNKSVEDSEELIGGDIDKTHRKSGSDCDIEIDKKNNFESHELKDGTDKNGDKMRKGKGTDVAKVQDNDKSEEMESSCVENDNNIDNDRKKLENSNKEVIKENMNENQINVMNKNTDLGEIGESDQQKDGGDADASDKGTSNGSNRETEKAQIHERSSVEKVVIKKEKEISDECNASAGQEKRKKKASVKRNKARSKKRQAEAREDEVLLGLVIESESSEEDSDESQRQSEDDAEEGKEKTKKIKEEINFDSESAAEKKEEVSVDRLVKKENRKGSDSEYDEEMKSEKGKIKKNLSKRETDSPIKKEDLKLEKDEESLQCVSNGIDHDTDKDASVKSTSKSKDKSTPKKRKGHSINTDNQKAKTAILGSDSENEFEDKPKPRSKKKHYRRHKNTQGRGQSRKKLNLKMSEKDMEELKEKQLGSKCQVLVEYLSSEVRKKLEDMDFIYTSDYPDLNHPTLPRQMFDSDGCDADEEDSDKEFSKFMKFRCDNIKPGPKSKSTKMKLKFMDDEGSEVNDNKDGISDDEKKDKDLDKKKKKATRQKKEGLLDMEIDESGEEDNEDDEVEEGDKKKIGGTSSLNEKMRKHVLMSSDDEADEEEEDEKDTSAWEKEEEEKRLKLHEKRKAAAKEKRKNEDSDDENAPKVSKKGYMNLNLSTDEEDNGKQKKGEDDDDEEEEDDPEPESAYEDDSDFEESPRKRRAYRLSSSDDSDSGKKKTKKKVTTEEESEEEEEKPKGKRKRIRKMSSSSDDDDDDDDEVKESPSKHKKIRKVIRDEDLMQTTKNATQEEEDRRKRIIERQKHYNEIFMVDVEKEQEGFDKLVLDFDPETKEELVSVHEKLVKSLKPHQFKGIKFMWDATVESIEQLRNKSGGGCILAHSMGLGKTLQVITFCHTLLTNKIVSKEVQRILVCCPVNTIFNWVAEFSIWLKGKMLPFDVIELASAKDLWGRAYRLDDWWREGGVCVMGYSMFRNLSNGKNKRYKGKMKEIFQKTLVDPGPDLVVCDEGHMLKNEKTALSIAINKIRTKRRIILTGTPLQNNLKEYHCMIQFIKPNLLGTKKEFMNRFANPIEQGQCVEAMPRDVRRMKRRAHILHNLLEGCVQRMDYTVLKPYLPPKFEYVISVQLSEIQCKLYQYYLDNLARGGPKRQSAGLFVDFGALSRIWTHPKVLELALRRAEYDDDEDGDLEDFICDDSTTSESSDDERSSKKKKSKKKNEESEEEEVIEEDDKPETVVGLTESGKVRIDWWKKVLEDNVGEDFEEEEYLDKLEHGGKLILLLDILRECCSIGDKVLVFSQSLLTLDVIEWFLQAIDCGDIELPKPEDSLPLPYKQWKRDRDYLRLDGSTAADARKTLCKIFNDPSNDRCRLFLISTKAGGLGINLVGANRVIIFDSSWNPSHDTQSIFRVYRFGQKKPSYIYRFVAQGTMEEKIYSRQVTKMSTALRVVDEHQIKRYFKMDELAQLYEFNPADMDVRETPIVPKDQLLAELLQRQKNWIVNYHEHESLLENQTSEELTEEERKAAWEDYENEKKGFMVQNYRNNVMPVMGAPTILNHPGLPSLSLSSFSLEGVVSTIKAQNPNLSTMELCESVLLATKQIQKVHLNHYQRVQAMVYNLKNPMIAPEQRKLLPFGNHPEMLPMLEQQLRLLEENIQRENQVITHIDQGTAQRNQLSTSNLLSAGLMRGQPPSSGISSATANYVERPSSSSAGRSTVPSSETSQEKRTGSNDVILLD